MVVYALSSKFAFSLSLRSRAQNKVALASCRVYSSRVEVVNLSGALLNRLHLSPTVELLALVGARLRRVSLSITRLNIQA
jgi:hypothetical protein